MQTQETIFDTFFLSGFECSTFKWKDGRRHNMITVSQHDVQADNDYKILRALGIRVSREGIPWPFVDKNGQYDFSCIDPMIAALNKYEITPIWDLCHYGYPDDLDPFSENFVKRFVTYCSEAAQYVTTRLKSPQFFSPINETTYFSFLGGKWGYAAPYKKSKGDYDALRIVLCKAAIAAVKAIRKINPLARMIHMDPLVEVVAPIDQPDKVKTAWQESHVDTYVAWDIIAGKKYPELGGSPDILDIVGVNNYSVGYMEYTEDGTHKALQENDKRVVSLCTLLEGVHKRYNRPIVISETSGVDKTRVSWMKDVMEEALAAINRGVNIQGICFYPAIGSPDWNRDAWVQSGFYNVENKNGVKERSMFEPYVSALLFWQKEINHITMLNDDLPFEKLNINTVIQAAKRLDPKPDIDWSLINAELDRLKNSG